MNISKLEEYQDEKNEDNGGWLEERCVSKYSNYTSRY